MLKLLGMLGTSIPAIITGLIAWIGRKYGTAAATIVLFAFLTVGFVACINQILGAVWALLDVPVGIAVALGMFIPADFSLVLGAIVSGRICRAAFDLAMEKTRALNSAS